MKTVLTMAALVISLGLSAGGAVHAGALNTFPDNIQFPSDFDGFTSSNDKKKTKIAE